MGALRSAFDLVCLLFFISHIPITLLVDSQALFPREWYPKLATDMMDNFLRDYKDPLVCPRAPAFFICTAAAAAVAAAAASGGTERKEEPTH